VDTKEQAADFLSKPLVRRSNTESCTFGWQLSVRGGVGM
jgi:hypothetical protein